MTFQPNHAMFGAMFEPAGTYKWKKSKHPTFPTGPERDLRIAAALGQTVILKKMIDAGTALDEPDDAGFTALMLAALQGQTECAYMLLQAGAHIEPRCEGKVLEAELKKEWEKSGWAFGSSSSARSALDIAREYHHFDIVRMLEAAEAKLRAEGVPEPPPPPEPTVVGKGDWYDRSYWPPDPYRHLPDWENPRDLDAEPWIAPEDPDDVYDKGLSKPLPRPADRARETLGIKPVIIPQAEKGKQALPARDMDEPGLIPDHLLDPQTRPDPEFTTFGTRARRPDEEGYEEAPRPEDAQFLPNGTLAQGSGQGYVGGRW